jgi:hypothetical protein
VSRFLPFSRDAFLALFEQYNEAVWPAPVVAYALGLVVLLSVLKPYRGSGRLIAAILAAAWVWNGVAYHMLHFAALTWAAWAFGFLFVLQGLMFAVAALRGRLDFGFRRDAAGWTGLALAVFAMAVYPLIGHLAGQAWPHVPSFGIAPCPLAIFTFGLLPMAAPRTPIHLIVIPLLWAAVGGSAAWLLAMPQDLALPVAAVLALALALRARKGDGALLSK